MGAEEGRRDEGKIKFSVFSFFFFFIPLTGQTKQQAETLWISDSRCPVQEQKSNFKSVSGGLNGNQPISGCSRCCDLAESGQPASTIALLLLFVL